MCTEGPADANCPSLFIYLKIVFIYLFMYLFIYAEAVTMQSMNIKVREQLEGVYSLFSPCGLCNWNQFSFVGIIHICWGNLPDPINQSINQSIN